MGAILKIKDDKGNVYTIPAIQGPQGETGPQGPKGETGQQGPKGEAGQQGPQGITGATGKTGAAGKDGENGKSAYEIALANGSTTARTEAEWVESMKSYNTTLPLIGEAVTITDGTGTAPSGLVSGCLYLVIFNCTSPVSAILYWDTSKRYSMSTIGQYLLRIETDTKAISLNEHSGLGGGLAYVHDTGTLSFYKIGST